MQTQFLRSVLYDSSGAPPGYPFDLPAIRGLKQLDFSPAVTFFTGENGSGKSTLLEALAVCLSLNAEGGSRNFRFATRPSHSPLWRRLQLIRGPYRPRDSYFLRAESFYNVATEIELLDQIPAAAPEIKQSYGGSMHERSHGESFLSLVQNRLGGAGLYLFDEPEAALSVNGQMRLLSHMAELCRAGSQFIISTHSPVLMAYPGALLYQLDEHGIRPVEYRQTRAYQLTCHFLNHPEQMARQLTQEESP